MAGYDLANQFKELELLLKMREEALANEKALSVARLSQMMIAIDRAVVAEFALKPFVDACHHYMALTDNDYGLKVKGSIIRTAREVLKGG